MKNLNFKKIEMVFDIVYMVLAALMGFILVSSESAAQFLWGTMAFVLVIGDSFHLLPRIIEIRIGPDKIIQKKKGRGKLIASITLSIFYSLIYAVGGVIYPDNMFSELGTVMTVLLILRIILCLLPQNRWASKKANPLFAILRNIPFLLQGILVFLLYLNSPPAEGLAFLSTAVFLSFLFYLPVVLFVNKYPMLGMLMLPKSLVYLWIISMGFALV